LAKIAEAAHAGVDYIQLREKDLSTRDLESLAHEAVRVIRESCPLKAEGRERKSALLINSRTDVALTARADGVHLRSEDVSPEDVRTVWQCVAGPRDPENSRQKPLIAVSCHSATKVTQAAASAATFAVFAPIFEKKDASPAGLKLLREACVANIPVLALGGITLANAQSCLAAGAAGIAAIRLFQEKDIAEVVEQLRG
jgi:thiamine-phosphate pyrophosphorylase